ncbi:NADPH-dependent FMN reductase [Flavobacterium nitrogenifigens]|uniref:NAD(P)H-dependent FMN reductase n=1 Tax=Flavobacterium nitrogenifigens TaxID=1617283 RepID=A0A521AI03_9FLAO|nr:NADPH-dependent FMN reductase [Flavobacterium nitrogenifigens]KAF2331549.1 NAD(P)H-dependent oxidoreductase [Flavobacterium nitrogenifigens]SMO34320.1 NAD(P)H-dependent FMN reductase [Flavobacterium nitrogenifigens]
MTSSKIKILAISGSTRNNSSNFKILKYISNYLNPAFEVEIFEDLERLPHFNPDLDTDNPPQEITSFRNKIINADGIIICTPEYVFSLPGSLKNALEWCVSTTIFSNKKTGLITASASGEMGHEQLLLVMKTIEAKFDDTTQLLIQGVRGKVNAEGEIVSEETTKALQNFAENFKNQFL